MARARKVFVAVVLGGLLAGCNVNTRFDITLHDDGSGTIRTTVMLDADAVQRMGGAATLAKTVPLSDLRAAGWTVSRWKGGDGGTETISLSHDFADASDLKSRIVDLVGSGGILRNPSLSHQRGWFSSHDAVSVVVDLRSPKVDIVHDTALASRLRAAGVDPASLQTQLAAQLKSALHVTVAVHLPDGHTRSYDAAPGTLKTVEVSHSGTDWNNVVKFGIGLALALLAALFFLAAGVGMRRNRRRAAERIARREPSERAPLM